MLDRFYKDVIGNTPAIMGTHQLSSFRGQSSPTLFRTSLATSDIDEPLLAALLVRWHRRYKAEEPLWDDVALTRSLNMAYHASLLPAGTDTTFYDVGRIVSLWVSAFEILVHPGGNGQANREKVLELIERTRWAIPASGQLAHDTGGKTKVKRTLASWLIQMLYDCRNDFLHGNPVGRSTLLLATPQRTIFEYAAPIEMLFYLKARGDVFDRIISDSEHNFLGYHIRAKLALPPEADFMVIDRDFATVVDDYMISTDLGVEPKRPKGVLETIEIPLIGELLSELRTAPPEIAAVVIELYEFSGAALAEVGRNIAMLRDEVAETRKAIKAFSLPTESGGLTYAVTLDPSERSHAAAAAIGRKHKYETKSDRRYVIVDSISTEGPIDGLLPLVWPWVEDADEADKAARVATMFRSRQEEILIGATKQQNK